jgi:hypothetical protein
MIPTGVNLLLLSTGMYLKGTTLEMYVYAFVGTEATWTKKDLPCRMDSWSEPTGNNKIAFGPTDFGLRMEEWFLMT